MWGTTRAICPVTVEKTRVMIKNINKNLYIFFTFAIVMIAGSEAAHAQSLGGVLGSLIGLNNDAVADLTDVSENITDSVSKIPGLISGLSYMMALVMGALAILKVKEHVENPNQTPLREPVMKFLAGGALLSLPIVYTAMQTAIRGDGSADFDFQFILTGGISAIIGGALGSIEIISDANGVMKNIIQSIEGVPGLITAAAYLSGLVLGVWAILNIKDHVESPQGNPPLKDGIIRLLIGGALFSLPTLYSAMLTTIQGGGNGALDFINEGLGLAGMMGIFGGSGGTCMDGTMGLGIVGEAAGADGDILRLGGGGGGGGGSSMGGVICASILHTSEIPAFLSALAYVVGLAFGFWGLLKIRDHVINPQQTTAWEGIVRLIAGGAMFALPFMVTVIATTVGGSSQFTFGFGSFNDAGATTEGLDGKLVNFMKDTYRPMTTAISWFVKVTGMAFVMIGISRLLKSSQDGPRGPGGIGTIMTFLVGGAMISFSVMIASMSMSLFNDPQVDTFASLAYTDGIDPDHLAQINAVIASMIKFMIVLGMISLARGLFIIRGVAEGSQQASLMAGITHMVGGTLAMNIGPVVMAVQNTLGLSGLGLNF